MKLRIALPALLAALTFGSGCDEGTRTLIVRNYGIFDAEVTWCHTSTIEDDDGVETTQSSWGAADLPAGQTMRRDLDNLDSLYLEVKRKLDGGIVLSETFYRRDFKGPNDELEVIVRP